MTPQIVEKLQKQIASGFNSEAEVVYFLIQARKLIERDGLTDLFYLKFHADWVAHPELTRNNAIAVIKLFEDDQNKALEIAQAYRLANNLTEFLERYGLQNFTENPNQYAKFLLLYTKVIEDIPLRIDNPSESSSILKIIVTYEVGRIRLGYQYYSLNWKLFFKDGSEEEFPIVNSFRV